MTDITAPAPVNGKSWFITGLGIGQIASWGSLYYSFPLVATAMEHDLGWDKTLIYGSATLGALLSALLAIPVGKAIDSGHGRLVMACSSVAAGFLLILWALTDNIVLFYLGSAGVGALQAAVLYEPAFAVIARRSGPSDELAVIDAALEKDIITRRAQPTSETSEHRVTEEPWIHGP